MEEGIGGLGRLWQQGSTQLGLFQFEIFFPPSLLRRIQSDRRIANSYYGSKVSPSTLLTVCTPPCPMDVARREDAASSSVIKKKKSPPPSLLGIGRIQSDRRILIMEVEDSYYGSKG